MDECKPLPGALIARVGASSGPTAQSFPAGHRGNLCLGTGRSCAPRHRMLLKLSVGVTGHPYSLRRDWLRGRQIHECARFMSVPGKLYIFALDCYARIGRSSDSIPKPTLSLIQEIWVQHALGELAGNGPGRCCAPRQGCHLTQECWVQHALDDVAGNIRQTCRD